MAEKSKKLNGYAKWILVIIAVLTVGYNTIATHVIAKNDIKHLTKDVERVANNMARKEDVKDLKDRVIRLENRLFPPIAN